jgi:phosphatidylglycerophosphatase C
MAQGTNTNVLALFDLDGTITTKDTFLEFIKYYHGSPKFYLGFLLSSPWLIFFKTGIIPNWRAKERVLEYFFKGESSHEFQQRGKQFCTEVLPALLKADAMAQLKKHQHQNHRVVIVTASAEDWVRDWCAHHNIEVLATQLAKHDGRITGKIEGKNCYGEEKVNRIKSFLDLTSYDEIFAYGDSSGDLPMLSLAHHKHYKFFVK